MRRRATAGEIGEPGAGLPAKGGGRRRWLYGPLLVILVTVTALVGVPRTAEAAPNFFISDANAQAQSFSVVWYSGAPATGSILVGATCATATTAYGQQTPSDGYAHLSLPVTSVGGQALTPSTTYYVKLVDDGVVDDNGGQCYGMSTLPASGSSAPQNTVFGFVRYPNPECSSFASGVLATLTVTQSLTTTNPPTSITSTPLAVMTSPAGLYQFPLGDLRNPDGSPMTVGPGDTLTITAAATASIYYSQSETYSQQVIAQPICLAAYPITPTATPGPTSSPAPSATVFVTSTPITPVTATPTGTLRPTPTLTSTLPALPPPPGVPTATATVIPTATPTATATATSPPSITAWTSIASKVVHPDSRQRVTVHTQPGVSVTMLVRYPDGASSFSAHGKAGKSGIWSANWWVVALQPGTAHVRLTLKAGGRTKTLNRSFRIG